MKDKKKENISDNRPSTIRSWTNDKVERPSKQKLDTLVDKYIKPKTNGNKFR